MKKVTHRRVTPPNELGRKALAIQSRKEGDGAQVIPRNKWRYYSDPKVGRVYKATLQNRTGTPNYGKIITEIPFGDLHFGPAELGQIAAIGRRFDLTANDSVRAFFEPKGVISQRWIDEAARAPKLRWEGADETAHGDLKKAMATLAEEDGEAQEPAETKERATRDKKAKTTRAPTPQTLEKDPAPLEG